MNGWKTYFGAAMIGLPGLLQLIQVGLTFTGGGGLDMAGLQTGLAITGAGLAAAGVGHKIDKAAGNLAQGLAGASTAAQALQFGSKAGRK